MLLSFIIALGCNSYTSSYISCPQYIELNMAQTKENPLPDRKMILSPSSIISVEEVIVENNKVLKVRLGNKEKATSVVAIDSKDYAYILEQINCTN